MMEKEIGRAIPEFIAGDDAIHEDIRGIEAFLTASAGILGEEKSEELKQTVQKTIKAQPILEDREDVLSWAAKLKGAMQEVTPNPMLKEKQAALVRQLSSKSPPSPIDITQGVFSAVLLVGVALGITGVFFSLPLMFVGIGVTCLGGGGALVSFAVSRSNWFREGKSERAWAKNQDETQVFERLSLLDNYSQVIEGKPLLSTVHRTVHSYQLNQSPVEVELQSLPSVPEGENPKPEEHDQPENHAKHG